jgi:membrane protease YdiL (CAAX protease family)
MTNHLENSFKGKNSLWRYAVMLGAVFLSVNTIGAIPLVIGFVVQSLKNPDAITNLASNPYDLSLLGFNSDLTLMMLLFPFLVGLITFFLLIKPLNSRSFRETITGSQKFRWNRLLVSALVWTALAAIYLFVYKEVDPENFRLNNVSGSLISLIIISLVLIPFQSGLEEVLFRGYLLQGLTVLFRNRWMSLLLSSVIFGLLHAWNPEIEAHGFLTMMPQYILTGLLFGIITIVDDGIEMACGAHIANNVFLSIMVTNSSSTLQTNAVFEQINIEPQIEFAALLAASVLFLIVLRLAAGVKNYSLIMKKPGISNS